MARRGGDAAARLMRGGESSHDAAIFRRIHVQLAEAMAALEAAGKETYRRIFRRHGMKDPLFGVGYADLGRLRKAIGRDQALAEGLWATGNGDARVLAAMIADPAAAPLEAWARDLDCPAIVDAFSRWTAAPSPRAFELAMRWIDADHESIEAAGWTVLGHLALGADGPDDEVFAALLGRIERKIHGAKNRVRYSMNGTLAAIGLRSEALRDRAIEAAARIGPVEVDHGATECKTPVAADVIRKGWLRRVERARQTTPRNRAAAARPAAKASARKQVKATAVKAPAPARKQVKATATKAPASARKPAPAAATKAPAPARKRAPAAAAKAPAPARKARAAGGKAAR